MEIKQRNSKILFWQNLDEFCNESGHLLIHDLITGESVPITKPPLPYAPLGEDEQSPMYSPETHKRHTLFCGTEILQGRSAEKQPIVAVVVRTGKGHVVSDELV